MENPRVNHSDHGQKLPQCWTLCTDQNYQVD